MTNDTSLVEGPIPTEQSPSQGTTKGRRGAGGRLWGIAAVIALALILWLPRLSGPIDLRWDAGVYYLLGTSLADGHGYRIPSEPGSPQAVQYPPLLPAFVALHQLALGTRDPGVVSQWLRLSYAALFVVYAVAIFALAQRYLASGFAVIAAALALLHVMTIFLSDVLFAEIPFALVGVTFALVAGNPRPASRPWVRETALFLLAVAGFLLRTAGVALLAAWVLEALVRRRWRLTLARGALALIPILGWQAYVGNVVRSNEYTHPAYEYQRASYQYYNVSYAENLLLIDSFRPELGRASAGLLGARLATNLARVVPALGEMVTTKQGYWLFPLNRVQHRILGKTVLSDGAISLLMIGFAGVVLAGLALLVRRRAWPMVFIILGSIGLICTTPWPGQFTRYLVPLTPFLTICAMLALSKMLSLLRGSGSHRPNIVGRIAVAAIILVAFAAQSYAALNVFRERRSPGARVVDVPRGQTALMFHDRPWQKWEEAINWIEQHSTRDVIVATSSPHLCYLRTGRRAVLPPMEADPVRAQELLAAVPVSYVIVDELGFVDISRRYALPAVENDPANWRLVYAKERTKIFEHIARPAIIGGAL